MTPSRSTVKHYSNAIRRTLHCLLTFQVPLSFTLIPNGFIDSRVESCILGQVKSCSDIFDVLSYLRPAGHEPSPVMFRAERERVDVNGNIAGQARVSVCEPGPADVVLRSQSKLSILCFRIVKFDWNQVPTCRSYIVRSMISSSRSSWIIL